ncbi:putative Hydrogenase nickel incorporation protein HypA [Candidatus Nitrospira inopinata]|uniref:Putative Hydrogenase nickel incorporation protein HypA n=2 Tax=Candidatus Nitrospira inopinata TaxID=1715989 RepID=A0A0S4KMH5_9BACT|nr:putative Hydrogenase nickel incorporation protein HypA [Candidatus Nitrospira inopinata]
MHELHLMKQVVKAVEAGLASSPGAKPLTVRLKVRLGSHMMEHEPSTIQTSFELAARGTRLEGATVEIRPFDGKGWCPRCRWDGTLEGAALCPRCGGTMLQGQEAPEVVVHEVVVEE